MKISMTSTAALAVCLSAGAAAAQTSPAIGETSLRPTEITCADLMAASEDERSGLVYFLAGYSAAGGAGKSMTVTKIEEQNAGGTLTGDDAMAAAPGTDTATPGAPSPAVDPLTGETPTAALPGDSPSAEGMNEGAETDITSNADAAGIAPDSGTNATGADVTAGTVGTGTIGQAADDITTGSVTAPFTAGAPNPKYDASTSDLAAADNTAGSLTGDVQIDRSFFAMSADQLLADCAGNDDRLALDVIKGARAQ